MLLTALFTAGVAHAQGSSIGVGFRQLEFSDAVTGQRVTLFVWYPTGQASRPAQFGPYTLGVARGAPPTGGRHRLVMISHGTGGDPLSHAQLGIALARRGYVAAAPRHAKDNSRDCSVVGTYEAGGYTALALVGGRADMNRVRSHCGQHPGDGFC